MREFLEDALEHRDDGYGRAQKHLQRELPKRFYKSVSIEAADDGHRVTLDGRQTRTPTKKPVAVPSRDLAEALRAEWDAQAECVDPDLMPHVRLINSAIEGGEGAREALLAEVIKFAGNDLLLYRADTPRELVALQEKIWDEILVKLARHFAIAFEPTIGILHKDQPADTLARLAAALRHADFITATALVSMTGLMGSGLLAIALRENLIDRDQAWTAAHLDEDYQIAQWGEDYEAAQRRTRRRTEFDAAVNVMEWLRN